MNINTPYSFALSSLLTVLVNTAVDICDDGDESVASLLPIITDAIPVVVTALGGNPAMTKTAINLIPLLNDFLELAWECDDHELINALLPGIDGDEMLSTNMGGHDAARAHKRSP